MNRFFIETLGEACVKTDGQIHVYCLMSNHFHLVLETRHGTGRVEERVHV